METLGIGIALWAASPCRPERNKRKLDNQFSECRPFWNRTRGCRDRSKPPTVQVTGRVAAVRGEAACHLKLGGAPVPERVSRVLLFHEAMTSLLGRSGKVIYGNSIPCPDPTRLPLGLRKVKARSHNSQATHRQGSRPRNNQDFRITPN